MSRHSSKGGGVYTIPESHIREFENQVRQEGGIDFAALCLNCLSPSEQEQYKKHMKAKGHTTKSVSRQWRKTR